MQECLHSLEKHLAWHVLAQSALHVEELKSLIDLSCYIITDGEVASRQLILAEVVGFFNPRPMPAEIAEGMRRAGIWQPATYRAVFFEELVVESQIDSSRF